MLGELGGTDEYSLVDALKAGKFSKPVVAWVSGTCARLFKSEVQFGHAGAKSGGQAESAQVSQVPPHPGLSSVHWWILAADWAAVTAEHRESVTWRMGGGGERGEGGGVR